MVRIADYVVVHEGTFDLQPGQDSDAIPITVHSDFVGDRAKSCPLLSYQTRPLSDQPVELRIDVGASTIENVSVAVNTVRAMWKAFDADLLTPGLGADNRVRFRNAGGGTIRISDVVVWYQRNIQ